MSTAKIEIPVEFYYSNKNFVPIKEIIRSLEGIEGLSHQLYTVAGEILGHEFKSSQAFIENIESGSLFEKVLIRFYFKDEKALDDFISEFGEEHPVIKHLIAALITAIFLYGCYKAIDSSPGGDSTTINGNNNVVINIKNQQLSQEDIKQIIERSLPDKNAIVQSSIKISSPGKIENGATLNIKAEGQTFEQGHTIEHQLLSKIPGKYKEPIQEKVLNIDNVEISIRAIDLDKRNQGWAGLVAGIDKRLPITIAPNVDISKIRDTTSVNVSIIYKKNDDNDNLRPTRVYIESLASNRSVTNIAKKQLTQEEALNINDVKTESQSNFENF